MSSSRKRTGKSTTTKEPQQLTSASVETATNSASALSVSPTASDSSAPAKSGTSKRKLPTSKEAAAAGDEGPSSKQSRSSSGTSSPNDNTEGASTSKARGTSRKRKQPVSSSPNNNNPGSSSASTSVSSKNKHQKNTVEKPPTGNKAKQFTKTTGKGNTPVYLSREASSLQDFFPDVKPTNPGQRITRSSTRTISAPKQQEAISKTGQSASDTSSSPEPSRDNNLQKRKRNSSETLHHPTSSRGGNSSGNREKEKEKEKTLTAASSKAHSTSADASHSANPLGSLSSTTGACASSNTCVGRGLRGIRSNSVCPQPDETGIPFTVPAATVANSVMASNNNSNSSGGSQDGLYDVGGSHDSAEHIEMNRLQALLEARGLPSQLFSALGPRMHNLLHRPASNPMNSKVQSLLTGMQNIGNESEQLQAAIEICQLLVMGNEETLGSQFPIKPVVQSLMLLLAMEHNFDIMNNACRALTYMMEALPRSTPVVVDAIPLFLQKLQRIECMDVAEQSLTALEMLSRRHSKNILTAGGVMSCLTFVDFFSINAQRNALQISANCCYHLNNDEFHYIEDCLGMLTQRLALPVLDKKSTECVCQCFTRLVDNFQLDEVKIRKIAGIGLLKHIQQLLIASPPILSTNTFVAVIRMLHLICNTCPDLAVELLQADIAGTLRFLLIGATEPISGDIELVTRTPQELHEIVCLIGNLMPRLSTDGIFSVDALLRRTSPLGHDAVVWQWKDDRGVWRPYTAIDSRILEAAFQAKEDEINLNIMGQTYTIDFHGMVQINESTGNSRGIQRRLHPAALQCGSQAAQSGAVYKSERDARADLADNEPQIIENFVKQLFAVLYEVYSSSAGPAVRHECLRAMLRMIYNCQSDVLRELLKNLSVSSHIANMLSSQDLKIVVSAVQLSRILLEKLPDVFSVYFRREGVMHQLEKLMNLPSTSSSASSPAKASSSAPVILGGGGDIGSVGGGSSPFASLETSTTSFLHPGSSAPSLCAIGDLSSSIEGHPLSTHHPFLLGSGPGSSAEDLGSSLGSVTLAGSSAMADTLTFAAAARSHLWALPDKQSQGLNDIPTTALSFGAAAAAFDEMPTFIQAAGGAAELHTMMTTLNQRLMQNNLSISVPRMPPPLYSSLDSKSLPALKPQKCKSSTAISSDKGVMSSSSAPITSAPSSSDGGRSSPRSTSTTGNKVKSRKLMTTTVCAPTTITSSSGVGGSPTPGSRSSGHRRWSDNIPGTVANNKDSSSMDSAGGSGSGVGGTTSKEPPTGGGGGKHRDRKHVSGGGGTSSQQQPDWSSFFAKATSAADTSSATLSRVTRSQAARGGFSSSSTASSTAATSSKASAEGAPRKPIYLSRRHAGLLDGKSPSPGIDSKEGVKDSSRSGASGVASGFFSSLPLPKWARHGSSSSNSPVSPPTTAGNPSTHTGFSTTQKARKTKTSSSGASAAKKSSHEAATDRTEREKDRLNRERSYAASATAQFHSLAGGTAASYMDRFMPLPSHYNLLSNSSYSNASVQSTVNKEKIRQWIRDQAKEIMEQYFADYLARQNKLDSVEPMDSELTVFDKLVKVTEALNLEKGEVESVLETLKQIVTDSDVSPFEIHHSGLILALLAFLTTPDQNLGNSSSGIKSLRSHRLQKETSFSSSGSKKPEPVSKLVFDGDKISIDVEPVTTGSGNASTAAALSRKQRLRLFCSVFLNTKRCDSTVTIDTCSPAALSGLVAKLNGLLTQIEQFPVKVHELPTGAGGGMRCSSALRFFHSHQLKCNLKRHPDCTQLRQWKRGPVKIDPLAQIFAIEKYMIMKGFGRVTQDDDDDTSDDDGSDEDVEETLVGLSGSGSGGQRRIQFVMNDHPLPPNMTIYQAVRQFGTRSWGGVAGSDTDAEPEISALGYAAIWVNTHTLLYRLMPEEKSSADSNSIGGGGKETAIASKESSPSGGSFSALFSSGLTQSLRKKSPQTKADLLWNDGVVPESSCPLSPYLKSKLPDGVGATSDPSLDCLCLLRVLNAINRYWSSLYNGYSLPSYSPILPATEFINQKLTAKATRQLQDPLVIMTGNLPQWLKQLSYSCQFLFPFETRQLLFYVIVFDRDRALQRLSDMTPELLGTNDGHDRVVPRLERRKCTIQRDDLLKQAEQIINDAGAGRAVLEIQYKDEVGTGLGPTLEFFALVSKELQKAELEMWSGEKLKVPSADGKGILGSVEYVFNPNGVYPAALQHHVKPAHLNKLKTKFKFLGKFLARALMDSRMLDLPLSPVFYKWLLGEEKSLSLANIAHVDHQIQRSLNYLVGVMKQKKGNASAVEDLDLDFTLPGSSNIELKRSGKDTAVTQENLEQYVKLVSHWLLMEGVSKQMEAVREGFESILPLHHLKMFYAEELDQLFCGTSAQMFESWSGQLLLQCIRPDHGYTHASPQIQWLVDIMSSFNGEHQRQFLQFVTGCPKLPVGGWKSLNPPLTVVRRSLDAEDNPDKYLPSVMTCVNYLKLPEYSSISAMRDKLGTAIRDWQNSFHLS